MDGSRETVVSRQAFEELEAKYNDLHQAAQDAYFLIKYSDWEGFANGVTDESGFFDEGKARASDIFMALERELDK